MSTFVCTMALQPSLSLTDSLTISSTAQSANLEALGSLEILYQKTPRSPQSPLNHVFSVSLKDPQKKTGKNKLGWNSSYLTYELSIHTVLPQFQFTHNTVRRRFNDFVQLYTLLRKQYHGCFIPPLPEKHSFEVRKLKETQIKIRMAELEKFLFQIGVHPELGISEEFVAFLSIQDEDLTASEEWIRLVQKSCPRDAIQYSLNNPSENGEYAVQDKESSFDVQLPDNNQDDNESNYSVSERAKNKQSFSNSVFESLKRIRCTLQNEFLGGKTLTEYEIQFRNRKQTLLQCEKAFSSISKSSENVINSLDQYGSACQEYGTVMMRMARFEEKAGEQCGKYTVMGFQSNQRSLDFQRMGYGIDKIADSVKKYALLFASKMIVIQDQLAMLPEAVKGLHEREFAFHVMEQIRLQLKQKTQKQQQQKQQIAETNKQRQEQLQSEVTQLQERLKIAEEDYQKQSYRNQEEMERYLYQRQKDMHEMLLDYVNLNIQMNSQLQKLWMNIAEQFQTFKLVDDEDDHDIF
eukprot:TRINITY_DN874_c1_g2_i1.p1 TRINITY_DN874_c1_g2~~TRINITY_DN874_c1_g2_i1.p1  ORF type:complete len:521 (-),score=39.21 TRINITY_DN874_c1_g2_i1:377-1939(-)